MSSIIFVVNEQEVMVATDTLATRNGEPCFFTTKTLIVPHLKLVIAGTGVAGFLDRWFLCVNGTVPLRGIDILNDHAPSDLAAMWEWCKEQLPIANSTTTVYHFGFSENTGLMKAYAYRSENNFKSEPLAYGDYRKPDCAVPAHCEYPQDVKRMMEDQRIRQNAHPRESRLYIGGEIQVHHLTKAGFNVWTLDRFDDYDADEKAMYSRLALLKEAINNEPSA